MTELRYGYTLADLHDISRLAVHLAGTLSRGHWTERYETAWSAVAEHLYAAEYWPPRHKLVHAGQVAILKKVSDDSHHHGFYKHKTIGAAGGRGSSPAFTSYWLDFCRTSPSPESAVVEREALYAILSTLTPAQLEAVVALAAHGDWQKAADAVGVKERAFRLRMSMARRRFLELWHEGEAPSRVWGRDRRAGLRAGEPRRGGTAMSALRIRKRKAAS